MRTIGRGGWIAVIVGAVLAAGLGGGLARGPRRAIAQVPPPVPTAQELKDQHAALAKFLGNASAVDIYLDLDALRQRTPTLSRVYPQRLERLGHKVFLVLSAGGSSGVEVAMIDTAEIVAISRQPIP